MIFEEIKRKIFINSEIGKEISTNAQKVCAYLTNELNEDVALYFNTQDISRHGSADNLWGSKRKRRLEIGISDSKTLPEDELLVNIFMTLYHEARHFEQLIEIKNGTAKEELIYSHLAKHDQSFYTNNYSLFWDELDADKTGVLSTYQYMMKNHPDIEVTDYLKNYLHKKSSFYSDIDAVKNINDFEDYFNEKLIFISTQIKSTDRLIDENSPTKQYLDNLRKEYEVYDREKGITSDNIYFHSCKTNIECDKFVSMTILNKNPDYLAYYNEEVQCLLKSLSLAYFVEQATLENNKDYVIEERE